MRPTTLRLALVLLISIAGCARELTYDQARETIHQNSLVRPTDNISVDAVSPSSATEAIVRATIAGQTMNLKFRRFDKGWAWEFVETRAGGWVAPDVAIGQVRAERQAAAAAKWADEYRGEYTSTAYTMSLMAMYNVPNPVQLENVDAWVKYRRSLADMFRHRLDVEEKERNARISVLTKDRQVDAWGNEIETRLAKDKGGAVVLSAGPDKSKGTEDDVVCYNTFT